LVLQKKENRKTIGEDMQKFEYNGKTYIKIKQDWYSEIGQKLPLKTAVMLDAEFNAMLIENEQSIVKLLDQTRHFLNIGSTKNAYDVIVEALSLATNNPEQTQFLPSVLVMYASVVRAVEKQEEGIATFLKVLKAEADIDKNPQIQTALASLYLDVKKPQEAIDLAHEAMINFKKIKRKVSDELMIVWSILKKDFPETYKAYREKLKSNTK